MDRENSTFIRKSRISTSGELARQRIGESILAASFDALNPNVQVLTPAIRDVPRSIFKRDVAKVKARVRNRTWGLLDPRSLKMQRWDLVVICALLITCVWAPYEVALIPTALNNSFVINQFVNLVFIMDIVATFFLPYTERGGLVTSHRRIAKRYLRSWFVIDFISCVPFEVVTIALSDATLPSGALKPIKMLRLLRLLKLARIAKASRILTRWENHITIPFSQRALLMWSMVLLLMLHWFSCAWAVVAVTQGSLRTPELQSALPVGVNGCSGCVSPLHQCEDDCLTDCEVSTLAMLRGNVTEDRVLNSETWICRSIRTGVIAADSLAINPFEVYMVPLSGMGFIGITYQHGNSTERNVYFVLYFISQVIWSMFVGAICGAIANTDPFTKQYRAVMEQLNHFLRENDAPLDFRLRAREYVRASRDVRKKNAFPALFKELSPSLRNAAADICSSATLRNVSVLADMEPECIMRLSQRLTYRGVSVGESTLQLGDAIMIITAGCAASGGRILTEGMSFGEDMVLTSQLLKKYPRPVIALTYLELAVLTHDVLFDTLQDFPESHQKVRIEANKMAIQRFGLVLQRANADKTEKTNEGLNDKDVELLLKTISGRAKLREIDLKRKEILENQRQMLSSRSMWVHSLGDRVRRTEDRLTAVQSLVVEVRDTLNGIVADKAVQGSSHARLNGSSSSAAEVVATRVAALADEGHTERAERQSPVQKTRPNKQKLNRSGKKMLGAASILSRAGATTVPALPTEAAATEQAEELAYRDRLEA